MIAKLTRHLFDLRRVLIRSVVVFLLFFLVLYYFSTPLYNFVALPLLNKLPSNSALIATHLTTPFLAPLELTLVLAIIITMPYTLYQLWGFIAPGLYPQERHKIWPLLVASIVLFYCGVLFAYWVVLPLLFRFFVAITPATVTLMPDMGQYLDLILKLFLAFGLAFEVPIITIVLLQTKIVNLASVSKARPYIIVGAFILGMLLTPPDVVSQILLAVPLWLLFELGILAARWFLL